MRRSAVFVSTSSKKDESKSKHTEKKKWANIQKNQFRLLILKFYHNFPTASVIIGSNRKWHKNGVTYWGHIVCKHSLRCIRFHEFSEQGMVSHLIKFSHIVGHSNMLHLKILIKYNFSVFDFYVDRSPIETQEIGWFWNHWKMNLLFRIEQLDFLFDRTSVFHWIYPNVTKCYD